ncbi:hypothetical protein THIX_60739 [Thiomonas sp. X19]|nr:hypothetical protein THIX_60739 [Thiomonas sp. X19]
MNPSLTLVLPLSLIVLSRLRRRDIDRAMAAALAFTAGGNMLLIGLQWRAGFPGPVPNTSGVHMCCRPSRFCLAWSCGLSRAAGSLAAPGQRAPGCWRPWRSRRSCRSTRRGRP